MNCTIIRFRSLRASCLRHFAFMTSLFLCVLLASNGVRAAEIRVLAVVIYKSSMPGISEAFKKRSGHSVDVVALPPAPLKAFFEKDRNFDVVLTIPASVDELVTSGLLVASTRRTVARSGIGIAVRSGAAKPDVSSSAALEKALKDAPTIAFSPGPSGIYLERLLAQMKIENTDGVRFKRVSGEPVAATVARGDAAIGFQQMGEMIGQPGIELLGPLPADVQHYTLVDGAIAANRENSMAALEFLEFLASPEARAIANAAGVSPP